eukprot:10363856-Ditylum_brightwellii.AAC.1
MIRWEQLSTGIGTPILETPPPYRTSKYINGKLHITDPWMPQRQSEKDQFIIDIFLQADIFSNHELLLLNYCRTYLRIVLLSDMTTSDRQKILPQ